mmetsp:Transcript_56472/g.89669  ORF Transcript_56472/g.89669 Transcript_56472/m.89669 type:complete len:218 (+) Transcript_56472:1639-2292(+)
MLQCILDFCPSQVNFGQQAMHYRLHSPVRFFLALIETIVRLAQGSIEITDGEVSLNDYLHGVNTARLRSVNILQYCQCLLDRWQSFARPLSRQLPRSHRLQQRNLQSSVTDASTILQSLHQDVDGKAAVLLRPMCLGQATQCLDKHDRIVSFSADVYSDSGTIDSLIRPRLFYVHSAQCHQSARFHYSVLQLSKHPKCLGRPSLTLVSFLFPSICNT